MHDPTRLTVDLLFLKASAEGTIPVVFVFTLTLLVLAVVVMRKR